MLPRRSLARLRAGLLALAAAAFAAGAACAGPVLGFHEEWPSGTQGWTGDGVTLSNPGTGGTLGDGYLKLSSAGGAPYGAHSGGPEYAGDWFAATIELVRVSMQDVGARDTCELHFTIGNATNLWEYLPGFVPPRGEWKEFTVNLADVGSFQRLAGSGTFEDALRHVDRIGFRHDFAPYGPVDDALAGDFGLDHLVLTAVATHARAATWAKLKRLFAAPAAQAPGAARRR